jgi:hypothetical protein
MLGSVEIIRVHEVVTLGGGWVDGDIVDDENGVRVGKLIE